MQRLVVLEVDVCLKRRFLCLCRFPVGFQLMVVVALPYLPRPLLRAALRQFFGFVRPLHAGIVFLDAVDFVMDENARFLCGAG